MTEYLLLVVTAIFVNNILLGQFLGNCPFLGTSQKMSTATGMAMAVVFVMTFAGMITYAVQWYLLVPYELEYLQTILPGHGLDIVQDYDGGFCILRTRGKPAQRSDLPAIRIVISSSCDFDCFYCPSSNESYQVLEKPLGELEMVSDARLVY